MSWPGAHAFRRLTSLPVAPFAGSVLRIPSRLSVDARGPAGERKEREDHLGGASVGLAYVYARALWHLCCCCCWCVRAAVAAGSREERIIVSRRENELQYWQTGFLTALCWGQSEVAVGGAALQGPRRAFVFFVVWLGMDSA